MQIDYNVTGSERKRLVMAISEILGVESKYKGAPTFAYEVDGIIIDKNGSLTFTDAIDKAESLIARLSEKGFEGNVQDDANEEIALCIEVPRSGFDERALDNLNRLVKSKSTLLKKAFGTQDLPILISEDRIGFPWFTDGTDPNNVKAYTNFIMALCEMAKTQKRVNTIERPAVNEKYAFRCFLLRLGFIGDEFKTDRKILLSKLSGNSAFKNKVSGGIEDE